MQCGQEFSFQDLKCKLVVNVLDGKILGNIIDIVFFPRTGKILGFVVPGQKKSWFRSCETIFIPYSCVCKVGVDVILVKLFVETKPTKPLHGERCSDLIGILDENGNPISAQNNQNQHFESEIQIENQYKEFNQSNDENFD